MLYVKVTDGLIKSHTCLKIMTTHFITAEIDLQQTPIKLQKAVETELEKQGKPLRWAITEVNTDSKTAKVEAIVTRS
jgi:hypothetical protein